MNELHLKMEKREKAGNSLSLLWDVLCAFCMACALVLDMNVRSGNNYVNWAVSLPTTPVTTVLFFAMLFVRRALKKHDEKIGGVQLLSLFLGFWYVLSRSVINTQNINQPFLSSGQLLKTTVMTLGMACIYSILFQLLNEGLNGRFDIDIGRIRLSRFSGLYRRHTTVFCAMLVMLMWLPHLVISFPGSTNSDTACQYMMMLGQISWNINHPLLYTALLEVFVRIAALFGGGNLNLFLLVLAQTIFSAMVIGYSQSIMRRMCAPVWLRILSLMVCGLMPVYCDNITVLLKDIPYAYAVLLLLCEVVRLEFLEDERYWRCAYGMVRFVFAAILLLAMRNNGMGILAPVIIVMAARAIHRKNMHRLACTLALILIPVMLTSGMKTVYSRGKVLNEVGIEGALSFPLQQTARFVNEHNEEIPENEKEIINEILEYDMIPYRYDPIISDPIKSIFREDATSEELMRYFGVWAKQFVRDPWCYFSATFIQNALMFDPQTYNVAIFTGTGLYEAPAQALGVERPEKLEKLGEIENNLRHLVFSLPMVAQLNSVGFYCILTLGVWAIACRKKVHGMTIVMMPSICTMIMILLSSTMTNQDRYGFPIIYCMPLMLACLGRGLRTSRSAASGESRRS